MNSLLNNITPKTTLGEIRALNMRGKGDAPFNFLHILTHLYPMPEVIFEYDIKIRRN